MGQRVRNLGWWIFALLFSVVPERCIHAQQSPKPVMTQAATPNSEKLNPSLPWISEYHQPFIYQVWWAEIARCEGIPYDSEKVRAIQFYQVNAPEFVPQNIEAIVLAVTYEQGQVYVAYPFVWNTAVIKHEMIHLLRLFAGDPKWYDHDRKYYGNGCRIPESGPPPPNQ